MKAFAKTVLFSGICLIGRQAAFAEFRTWTNASGAKIEAEFVKSEGGNVTLRLKNGSNSTFSESKLSADDIAFIKAMPKSGTPEEPKAAGVDAKRKARWVAKMDKAKKEAEETGLPILLLFTGTDWCPYCVKLEDAVFAKKDFKEFADKNLVLLKLDFPGGGGGSKEDKALAKEYGVTGYPKYFLIDAAGKQMGSGGYNDGINPEKFAAWVTSSTKAGK